MKTLEKTNPLTSLKSIIEDFWNADGFLSHPIFNHNYPTVNIIDKNGAYEVKVSAPGFKKEDFKVAIENGSLTISAETSSESKEEKENYLRKEFSTSSFSRSFRLPDNITQEQIKANYQDGLLNISVMKANPDQKNIQEIKVD
ncbi:Hsp20/alpha crystallin family protein [Chryseobacterium daecheongense]|uniref:Heat shock protein Hsp20 n=1 Tax=Chryseobacterium daecheongense TaxID=192389 RepID=A0A3N0W410_9FLAO|nr:Hsp20/alpha crystallin family protein [Chryseobacterium daecheongense]ROH99805.1 Hsp20/alpha crystallin family protein [Chryseobacterium daecheongense]TDX95265.1 heat shock protein Hsp20 [Chryseobacterium daecheongense]